MKKNEENEEIRNPREIILARTQLKDVKTEIGEVVGQSISRYRTETGEEIEEPIGDRFDVFNQLTNVETTIQHVNRDWTLSSLTDYEKRFVLEMSKTGTFVEEWMTARETTTYEKTKDEEFIQEISTRTEALFSQDYLKRLILSRAKNGMVVKGGILAVVGGQGDEGMESAKGDNKGPGILSRMGSKISGIFGGK